MQQDLSRVLNVVQYDIEVWDWKTNTYVADISKILTDGLSIAWTLNDVETVDFTIDLVQFEKMCQEMGVTPSEVLTPYVHDLRIRRNGEYIIGVQVVETNITINNDAPATIQVKCTGFLNLFKDQYLTASWSGYTYAEIARKLIMGAQNGDNLVSNGTIDIDTAGWLPLAGVVSRQNGRSGDGALRVTASSGSNTWVTTATRLNAMAGTNLSINVWVNCQAGRTLYVRERELANIAGTQRDIATIVGTGSGWLNITTTYQTFFDDGYIMFEFQQSGSGNLLWLDDLMVLNNNDTANFHDLKVTLGVDTASPLQNNTRQRNYSLQNVKDAIINLTALQNDNFDFAFSEDRTFNCYSRMGSEKPEIEATYPGNVHSMTITRSAANLANSVTNIGSGIGDERLQITRFNQESRLKYGTREAILTNNNVVQRETLLTQAAGELWDRKDPTDLPKVVVKDGSLNPSNIKVGDSILIQAIGDEFINTINGMYRIVQLQMSTDLENSETINMTLEPPVQRPAPNYIRYIKDTIAGSTANAGNHWVEIQALMLNGNEFINVARGKAVTGTSAITSPTYVTDGILNTNQYTSIEGGQQSLTIDLGGLYPIDFIQVWHYWADGRSYKGNTLSVGKTNVSGNTPLETILWQTPVAQTGWVSTSGGRRSRWLQEDIA